VRSASRTSAIFCRRLGGRARVGVDRQEGDAPAFVLLGELGEPPHVQLADRAVDPGEHDHGGLLAAEAVERHRLARRVQQLEIGDLPPDAAVDRRRLTARACRDPRGDGQGQRRDRIPQPSNTHAVPRRRIRTHPDRGACPRP